MRKLVALLALPLMLLGLAVVGLGSASPASAATTTSFSLSPTSVAKGGSTSAAARSSFQPRVLVLQEWSGSRWVTIRELPAYRNYGFTVAAGAVDKTRPLRVSAKTSGGAWIASGTVTLKVGAGSQPGSGNAQLDAARAQIVRDTNAARTRNGLPALKELAGLHNTAQGWAVEMARSGDFRHNPSYTSTYPSGWRRAGENIAAGYGTGDVVNAWMNSDGHRANILGDYTHIGVGVAWDASGYPYYVQNFGKY